jgi:hypothetical protein
VFAVPTSKFAKYQLTEALPWWFQRYILFRKNAELRPLYDGDGELDENGRETDMLKATP